jgi:hypothetical protein
MNTLRRTVYGVKRPDWRTSKRCLKRKSAADFPGGRRPRRDEWLRPLGGEPSERPEARKEAEEAATERRQRRS